MIIWQVKKLYLRLSQRHQGIYLFITYLITYLFINRDKKKLNLEESIKKSKFTNETNRESRILKDTKQIYETIYILEKAKKITEEEEEKQLSGFDKFINMLNPFKCTK